MKIFRFEKNEERRLEAIKRREIYISPPKNFNDLEDCRIQGIHSPIFDYQVYKKLLACVEILYPDADDKCFELSEDILDNLKEIIENLSFPDGTIGDEVRRVIHRDAGVQKIRKFLRERTGVCCFFKEAPEHPLMWAHYANSHTGFCIEYEIDQITSPLYEVNYASRLPSPSIKELILCPEESFLRILTTKTSEWSYEKEVRVVYLNTFINGEGGKSIPLPSGMKPVRLIKGAKFVGSKNEELLKSLELDIVPYKRM